MTTFDRLGPRTAASAMARRSPGKARNTSMTRTSASSSQPPTQPDAAPSATPTSSEIASVAAPTTNETRAPYSRRVSTSRPSASRPSGWAPSGGRSRSSSVVASGSPGATNGAARPARHIASSTSAPARAVNRPRALRRIAEPRVEHAMDQVRRGVGEEIGERDREHAALDQRVVARVDGLHDEAAEPGPGEDGLGDDGARQEPTGLEAGDRDHRRQRVAERVDGEHPPLRGATGARRAHPVLAQ